jgi:hypothetical protein
MTGSAVVHGNDIEVVNKVCITAVLSSIRLIWYFETLLRTLFRPLQFVLTLSFFLSPLQRDRSALATENRTYVPDIVLQGLVGVCAVLLHNFPLK